MAQLLRHLSRHASGEFLEVGERGRREGQTMACCHCGRHWEFRPGSGEARGWCYRCGRVTCGRRECSRCLPYEEQLHHLEQRLALWRAMQSQGPVRGEGG